LIETAGPDPSTPLAEVRLAIGVVIGAHGVRGDLKLKLSTDDPEHLEKIRRVFIGDEPTARRVTSFRLHSGLGLLHIKGISTPEAAKTFQGKTVRIAGADARPLDPGEFYLYQVTGLPVFDETGTELGKVTDIMETGAQDIFVVTPPGGGPDQLFPNHPSVVLDLDLTNGRIVVRPLIYAD
jgi:16S rRNA processing protein RimM